MLATIEYPISRSEANSFVVLKQKSVSDQICTTLELASLILECIWAPSVLSLSLGLYAILLDFLRVFLVNKTPFAAFAQCTILYPIQVYLYWHESSFLIYLAITRTLSLYLCTIGDFPARVYENPPREPDSAPTASLFRLLTCCWNTSLLWKACNQRLEFEYVPLLEEKMNTWSLISSDFCQFWSWFSAQAVLGALGAVATLTPTFFINQILKSIESGTNAWPYVAGIGISIIAGTTVSVQGEYYGYKLSKGIESVYMARIHNHALLGTAKAGKTINLISVDVGVLAHYGAEIHCLISNPVIVCGGLVYLYRLLGISMLAGLSVLVLTFPLNWWIGSRQGKLSEKISATADERMERTSEAINGIRPIKYFAWEPHFVATIMASRKRELRYLWKKFQFNSSTALLFFCVPLVTVSSSFYSYVYLEDKPLTSSIAFTSISVFQLLQHPLNQLMQIVNEYKSFKVSWDRVQTFLSTRESPKLDVQHVPNRLGLEHATMEWPDGCTCLIDASFEPVQGLTVVTGTTGSGKTALLLALLGELTLKNGNLYTPPLLDRNKATLDIYGLTNTIAYCPQSAWVINDTLRSNILLGAPLDGRRYRRVLEICDLNVDFATFAHGDGTLVGTRGVTLSGGQKHRIALARALYSNSRYVLLDDVFSALDYNTGRGIYDKLVPFCENRILVLASHSKWAGSRARHAYHVANGVVSQIDVKDIDDEPYDTIPSGLSEGKDKTEDTVDESRARGQIPLATYLRYAQYLAPLWGWILMACVFAAVPVTEYLTNYWLSVWANSESTNKDGKLNYYAGVYAILVLIMGLNSTFVEILTFFGSIRGSQLVFERTITSVLAAQTRFFDTTPIGQIINRFSKDIHVIDEDVVYHARVFVRCVLDVLVVVAVITWAQPWFLVAVVPVLGLYLSIGTLYSLATRELKRLVAISRSPIYQQIEETVTGSVSIRAYGIVEQSLLRTMNLIDRYHQCDFNLQLLHLWLAYWGNVISSIVVTLAACFVVRGNLNAGMAGIVLSYSMLFNDSVHWAIRLWGFLQASMNSVERLFEYQDVIQETCGGRYSLPKGGSIEFKDFCVRYQPHLPLILENVNFSIKSGEKVGIIGRTGSGKSTIIAALFRMVEAASGSILINGVDTQQIPLAELRGSLSIIPQDPTLFEGTLRHNLDIEDKYSKEQLLEVLCKVQLGFDLDHEVQAGGSNMSQGQRQLVCLARALLRRAEIMVMDEATASIDHETDHLIQKTIRRELKGATVITIAHRIESLEGYDTILEVIEGRVLTRCLR